MPERTGPGRHRHPRRAFGPAAVGVLVALMLGGLGAGAAFLPESLVGTGGTSGQGGASGPGTTLARDADLTDAPAAADALPPVTPAASPSPAAVKPSPTKATPSPSRSTTKPKPSPTRTQTTQAPDPPDTPDPPAGADTEVEKVVEIVNRERAAGGCPAVTMNAKLNEAAQLHSQDQAAHNTMSHDGSDGSSPWDRARRAGYENAIGENVAMGYRDAEAVMDGWMNSSGHRNNIMNCSARAIGMGLAKSSSGVPYWTQMFGSVA
jgi:uncharacterized protein YkwD